ncbi:MAG: hypothetical protein ACRDRI_18745 [Pseudonocardiaceae bacterium]
MYRIIPDAAVSDRVADEALAAYADVLGALAVTPWNGPPQHEDTRTAPSAGGPSAPPRPARSST